MGTLDRSDLHQIIARIAVIPKDKRGDVRQRKLSELLPANPVHVALEDSALAAYATMLDHGVPWLPVVHSKNDPRPVGCLRQEKISNLIIQKIGQMEKERARAAS